MTDIAFHFNVADPVGYALRLLRKAYRSGAHVVVLGDKPLLTALDSVMWSDEAAEFLPHSQAAIVNTACLATSPIVLVDALRENSLHQDVLLNLQHPLPPTFAQFKRVIEIVSTEEVDRLAARNRWRFYASRGYSLSRHEAQSVSMHA